MRSECSPQGVRSPEVRRGRRWTWFAGSCVVAAAGYAAYAAYSYGRPRSPKSEEVDPLLDAFMPSYDVVERHHIHVSAPAAVTLGAAKDGDMQASAVVRGIFRARGLLLGAIEDERPRPKGLLEEVQALGWGVLAAAPDQEIVIGAVTKPWEPDVTFRALSPQEFLGFQEPGYVKIVWTLRADTVTKHESVFRTETRAVATDAQARRRFRRYWSFFSPGIILIRWALLGPLKREAERRARQDATAPH